MKYTVVPYGNDFILTILDEGEYKGVPIKIVDLHLDENEDSHPAIFEMELPKNKQELFNDEKFTNLVQTMVGDAVMKSLKSINDTQRDMAFIEEQISKKLDSALIVYDKDRTLLEQFMEKGFILKKSDDKVIASDIKNKKDYDIDDIDDFKLLTSIVFPSIIVN